MLRTKRQYRLACAVRILSYTTAIVALASFGSPSLLVAQTLNTLVPSTPAKLPDSAVKGAHVANTEPLSIKTDEGSDADKVGDKKSGESGSSVAESVKAPDVNNAADDDDERDDADNSGNHHQRQVAQKSESSGQKDESRCDQQDADASDSEDDQDTNVSAPDEPDVDQQRNYQENKVAFYRDSEGYRTATVTAHNHLVLDNFLLDLTRNTVVASDAAGSVRTEDMMFSFLANLNENLGVGGGFGTVYSQGWSLPIGSLQTTANFMGAALEASVSRTLLATTAQALRSRIMQTEASSSVSYQITRNLASSVEIHHINYSDHNSSIGLEFTPQYTFHLEASQLQVGYDFSYQSFANNPNNNAYWAPKKALSNGMSGTWSFDHTGYYGRSQLGLSYDSVRMSGKDGDGPSSGPGASASFVFGIRPTNDLTLEAYWTGNGSPGWSEMNVGLSLKFFF
jgi:hypothetical protein